MPETTPTPSGPEAHATVTPELTPRWQPDHDSPEPLARALRVAWTPDAEPHLHTPETSSLWESWSAALDELISNPHDQAAHQRLLFYSRAEGSWGAYNLNLVRQRFATLEQPGWYREAVDIQVVWAVNQAVAFAPYDPAARRALVALRSQLPQHPQLARDVATNFPATLAGREAAKLSPPEPTRVQPDTPAPAGQRTPHPAHAGMQRPEPEPGEARRLADLIAPSFPEAASQPRNSAVHLAGLPQSRQEVDLTPHRGIICAALEFYIEGMRARALEYPRGATRSHDAANLAEQARRVLDERSIGVLTGLRLPVPRGPAPGHVVAPERGLPTPPPPARNGIER